MFVRLKAIDGYGVGIDEDRILRVDNMDQVLIFSKEIILLLEPALHPDTEYHATFDGLMQEGSSTDPVVMRFRTRSAVDGPPQVLKFMPDRPVLLSETTDLTKGLPMMIFSTYVEPDPTKYTFKKI